MKFRNSLVRMLLRDQAVMPVTMSSIAFMAFMTTSAIAGNSTDRPVDAPQPQLQSGRDYHSIQIASSSSRAVLERQFPRYARLPYVRIEQRGALYVLRAGFWTKAETAQAAGAAHTEMLGAAPLVRVATYRPEMIRKGNWPGASADAQPQMATASVNADGQVESLALTAEPAPASPVSAPSPSDKEQATLSLSEKQPRGRETAILKPYDAEDYTLAFDAFLGGGDRERAFIVASKAVESVPEDMEWRRKLARVAEWTQRPVMAWTQWFTLYRQGDRSTETQTAVLRLAPLFDDPGVAIEVWKNRVSGGGGRALTDAQWQDIYNLFESASQPLASSLFFEQQYRRLGKVKLLDYAAQEAEYGGDDERALQLYGERVRAEPFSQEACLRAAIMLLRRDREREAYTLLEAQRARASEKEIAYWDLLTNMALNLAETRVAESAMRQLNASKEPERADWDRLIALLRIEHPARAADLSMERYRRTGQAHFFMMTLEFYSQTENRPMQTRLLAGLSPEARGDLEKDAHFLRLRARYYQLSPDKADVARAWSDLQHALVLQPDEPNTIAAVLWFLLDQHRLTELAPLLDRYAAQAEKDSTYWLLYAAAYHGLDQYRHALPWYRKEIERSPDDNLLLLNYADLLERLQQPGMAERVRRHAWLRLREKYPEPPLSAPLDAQPELLALVRLALQNNPGDPGLALVRRWVSELRGLPVAPSDGLPEPQAQSQVQAASSPPDQQTRDLILGWAISHEQHPEARAWMWFNQVRNQSVQGSYRAPLWGEAQAALQDNDTQRMDKLLLTQGNALPIYNRYDIAHALEHWPQEQEIAFHGMNDNEVDEELYDRYRQHVPRHMNHVQWRTAQGRYGALDSREQRIDAHLAVSRRLHLDLGWEGFTQSSHDATLNAPPRERLSRVGVQWLGTYGDTTLTFFHRDELTGRSGWRATQAWTWDRRLALNGIAEYRGAATDSLPLRVYGYQDSVSLGANYTLSRREYLAVTQRLSRYYTQRDDALGHGHTLDLEAGYRFRLEYPDWRTRLYATTQSFSYDGAVSERTRASLAPSVQSAIDNGSLDAVRYFLPQGSTTVGACLGMGENLAGQNMQDVYTRAWRPYYDVCANHNNLNGAGYSGYIGMAGTVDGEDHLALRIEQSSGGTGTGALSRTLSARYRHYF